MEKNPDITCHFDHLVGDFDTISPEILKNYLDREDIEVHRFNPEKDYTDTDIALKLAIHLIKSETGKADAKSKSGFGGYRYKGQIICWPETMQLLAQTRAAGVDGVISDKNKNPSAGSAVLEEGSAVR